MRQCRPARQAGSTTGIGSFRKEFILCWFSLRCPRAPDRRKVIQH